MLLDAVFGPREVLHEMECGICGNDEIYFRHPHTKETLGRACKTCNFVQKFDKENSETNV
jgi:DNA-directed RNA polymerase subunit M/transcription elongation factor TFIIS